MARNGATGPTGATGPETPEERAERMRREAGSTGPANETPEERAARLKREAEQDRKFGDKAGPGGKGVQKVGGAEGQEGIENTEEEAAKREAGPKGPTEYDTGREGMGQGTPGGGSEPDTRY